MTDTFVPALDQPELQRLVDDARISAQRLGAHALTTLTPATAAHVTELLDAGWRITIETATDRLGQVVIALTAISPSGADRRAICTVAQGVPRASAH